MQGKIMCESVENQYALFNLYFPKCLQFTFLFSIALFGLIRKWAMVSEENTGEKSCLSLFPITEQTLLKNREMKYNTLKLMSFFVNQVIKIIKLFLFEKKLYEFDPHVGDTLCQIRAYAVLLISLRWKKNNIQITSELAKYNAIYIMSNKSLTDFEKMREENSSCYNKSLDKQEEFKKFIENSGLMFQMSSDVFFLTQCYILTKFSKVNGAGVSTGIDYERLCFEANMSKSFAKKLMHYFQKNIAEYSCKFIIELLRDLKGFKSLKLILPHMQLIDADKRSVLPCYEVTKILLAHILKYDVAILIVVNSCHTAQGMYFRLLFPPNKEISDFELRQDLCTLYAKRPCVVIRGVTSKSEQEIRSSFLSDFIRLGLTKILLANMAKHPQYSSHIFEHISENPYIPLSGNNFVSSPYFSDNQSLIKNNYSKAITNLENEFLQMKKIAEAEGCCKENPNLFLVKHIFCDILENYSAFSDPLVLENHSLNKQNFEFTAII